MRLHKLPSYITIEDIRIEIAKFGEVSSIEAEKYKVETRVSGILAGARTVPYSGLNPFYEAGNNIDPNKVRNIQFSIQIALLV